MGLIFNGLGNIENNETNNNTVENVQPVTSTIDNSVENVVDTDTGSSNSKIYTEAEIEQLAWLEHDTSLKDGVDYININPKYSTELGSWLHPSNVNTFNTFLGPVASVKSFLTAIKYPGYPLQYLTLPNKTGQWLANNNVKPIRVPNYMALTAYALYEKAKAYPEFRKLLMANTLPYTAYSVIVKKSALLGEATKVIVPNLKLKTYAILAWKLGNFLRTNEGKLTSASVREFLTGLKEVPDVSLIEGVACKVTTVM